MADPKYFWNQNPLIPIGLVILAVWVLLAILDLGLKNPDLKFALNYMAVIGMCYGAFILILGLKEYRFWKKELKRGY